MKLFFSKSSDFVEHFYMGISFSQVAELVDPLCSNYVFDVTEYRRVSRISRLVTNVRMFDIKKTIEKTRNILPLGL